MKEALQARWATARMAVSTTRETRVIKTVVVRVVAVVVVVVVVVAAVVESPEHSAAAAAAMVRRPDCAGCGAGWWWRARISQSLNPPNRRRPTNQPHGHRAILIFAYVVISGGYVRRRFSARCTITKKYDTYIRWLKMGVLDDRSMIDVMFSQVMLPFCG